MDFVELLLPYQKPMLLIGTAVMAAAGWWCQWVRYPAFSSWPAERFLRNHALHTFQISLVVIPGMLMQAGGTALLFAQSDGQLWYRASHVVLCLASLGPTFLVSGPLHGKLSRGQDHELIRRLIRTNLPRTIAWTVQCGLALFGLR